MKPFKKKKGIKIQEGMTITKIEEVKQIEFDDITKEIIKEKFKKMADK